MNSKIFTFLVILLLSSVMTFGQNLEVKNYDRNGYPTFVKFDTKGQTKSMSEAKEAVSNVLNIGKSQELRAIRTEKDQFGYTHEKFQQYYKGIKVENGVYYAHGLNGVVVSMNGEFKAINELDVNPTISEAQAEKYAKAFIGADEYMGKNNPDFYNAPELVIVANSQGKHPKDVHPMVLAYKIDVYATNPVSRTNVYVNAKTGKIAHINATLHSAVANGSADTRYSGTKTITTDSYNGSYRLRDYSRGDGIITYDLNESTNYSSAVDFTDYDNNWTAAEYDNSAKDNGALDAHWAGMMTYDYWKDVHGRNSFNNSGALIKTYVHFDQNYDNAYWNGSVMTFGDGSQFDILTSLDVFGHEFGHAVCSYTADLTYQNESGALNEAYSDIWGCAIEHRYAPEKQNWQMGEDLGSALRSISDPKSKGLPDTYLGDNWAATSSSPSQYNDYGGVHTNNGPFVYWFYLISEGGSGTNDNNDSYTVNAIGIDKAEKITYRIESIYMSSSSDYADARTYAIQSAIDLYGAGSDEEIAVTNAMYAIGVGDAYGGTTPNPGALFCESKGNDASYEWISKVEIGSYSNSSSGAGYSDFTSEDVQLSAGQSYNITLTPGFASSTYNEYFKVWIDYNNDTIFDNDELAFDAGALSQTAVSGTMTIPSSATGTVRMRVSMKYNAEQTACETFSYGEVEDYNVTFGTVVVDPPVASFAANTTTITEGGSVSFTDQSSNNPTSWSWSFEGGTPSTSSSENPTVTYNTPGTYNVSLTVANAGGSDSKTISNYITVEAEVIPAPVANFSASSTTIAVGGSVSFTDQSTNNPTSWNWSFAGGTPSTSTAQNPTVTYNTAGTYQVSLTAANAGGSDTETKASYITVEDVVPEYCASKGSNVNYEWIAGVEIGTFINNTGANGGYADFTSKTCDLAAGQSVNVKFTPGFASSSYSEYWTIWIDYNGDYDFDDAGEQVFTGNGTSVVSGSFNVASGASGTTRMRVTMKYNAAPTACETFSYGEVEDYTVTFGSVVVVKPVANFTANTTSIEVGQSVSFSDLSTNNPTAWSWSFAGGTPSTSSTQNPTVTYNTAGTYQVSLTASNSAGSDSETKYSYITVNENVITYCSSKGNNVNYEWIAGVKIGSFTNNTGANNGYADFTNMTVNLTPGASESITLTPGFSGSTYTEYWVVWIDYNKDGDFTDAGEQVASGNSKSAISKSITVASSASGTTRMRVTMKYNAAPTSCETFTYGEVEDYTVSFGSKEATGINEITQQINIYPQPADNMLHIEMTEAGNAAEVVLYNMNGQAVKTTTLNNNGQGFDLDISGQSGGIYMLQLVTNGKVTTKQVVIK